MKECSQICRESVKSRLVNGVVGGIVANVQIVSVSNLKTRIQKVARSVVNLFFSVMLCKLFPQDHPEDD